MSKEFPEFPPPSRLVNISYKDVGHVGPLRLRDTIPEEENFDDCLEFIFPFLRSVCSIVFTGAEIMVTQDII